MINLGETGWPTAGSVYGANNTASVSQLQSTVDTVKKWLKSGAMRTRPQTVLFFSLYDETLCNDSFADEVSMGVNSNINYHWGLYTCLQQQDALGHPPLSGANPLQAKVDLSGLKTD
ncbi:glycosyl hydrolase family 17 protein [Piscirickettsia litoralis]|uniref:Glucan endo-1,3-beta-D-glucosidase n=1 Tax=Piscirickettsia litoralis TaxID=1891921 RepID=A0ABX3A841_9GAMM|nr:glycosyl hydrolase family 17 protein [Piscirickettsia litoralis]ODN43896.1 hypothetical protein BGC07_14630 [Piscirickettsia litoralis]